MLQLSKISVYLLLAMSPDVSTLVSTKSDLGKYNKWLHEIILIQMYEMNTELGKEQIRQICQNRKLIAVLVVCCPFMLHVYGCVFCSISLLSVYMCVRMPLSSRSIAGVPSSQALPGYLITAHHLCAFLLYLRASCVAAWQEQKTKIGRINKDDWVCPNLGSPVLWSGTVSWVPSG